MSDETKNTNEEAATTDAASEFTKAIADLSAKVEALTAAKAAPKVDPPKAEQSHEQAIENERRRVASELKAEDVPEHIKSALRKEWEEKYIGSGQYAAEFEQRPQRQASPSLADATDRFGEALGIKPETKSVFGRLGLQRAQRSGAFATEFGQNRTPLDVLMHGAHTTKEMQYGSRKWQAQDIYAPGRDDELIRRWHDLNDAALFWRLMVNAKGMTAGFEQCPYWTDLQATTRQVRKALDTTDTSNWTPTGFSSALYDAYELPRSLLGQLQTFQMPRNQFDYPVQGARTTTYLYTENTADPESATVVTTSDLQDLKVTLALFSLATRTSWSLEVDEDSIIVLMSQVREEMMRSYLYTAEDIVLNADTAGTHMDSDVTAATDARKACLGLRAHAVDQSYSTDISSFNANTINGLAKSMVEYGANPDDMFYVGGPSITAQLRVLTDSNNNPVMLGSPFLGAGNVSEMGRVTMLFGSPYVTSQAFRQNLNASGVYDGTTTTKTGMLAVNRRGFLWCYTNQAPRFLSDTNIRTAQFELVMHTRREFEDVYAIASNKTVWYGYNVTA